VEYKNSTGRSSVYTLEETMFWNLNFCMEVKREREKA
jgi:hypothetical protein